MNIPQKEVGICCRCGRHAIIFAVREDVCYKCYQKMSMIKQRRKFIAEKYERLKKTETKNNKLDVKV